MSLQAGLDAGWTLPKRQLVDQLRRWRARTGPDPDPALGPVLPEQTSQLERLVDVLLPLVDQVAAATTPDPIRTGALRRDGVHALALVWEFFRSRLAQRDSPDLRPGLLLADDLAWACWRPARDAAIAAGLDPAAVRAPPLVAYGTNPIPVAWERDRAFPSAALAPPWDRLFHAAVEGLPVPIVELPWGAQGHLPIYAAVAHEVGHCVEGDFGLRPELDARLVGLDPAWTAWRSELLADAWGLLGCGAGYLATLAAALAGGRAQLVAEAVPARPGAYPPAMLRTAIVLALAEAFGIDLAPAVAAAWTEAYGTSHAAQALEAEIPAFVAALTAPFVALGGRRLAEVLPPPTTAEIRKQALDHVLAGAPSADGRRMVAGAAWARFERAAAYAAVDERRLLVEYARPTVRKAGVRAPARDPLTTAPTDPTEADRDRIEPVLRSILEQLEAP